MKFEGKKTAINKLSKFYKNQWLQHEINLTEYPNIENPDLWTHEWIPNEDRSGYKKYFDNGTAVKVIYHRKKYGRWHVKDSTQLSSTIMHREMRSTLFGDTEYDFDMVSAYPSIIMWILTENIKCKTKFSHFENYLNNRQQIFDKCDIVYTEKTRDTKYDTLKKFVCLSIFGGLIENHAKETCVDLEKSNLKPLDEFIGEVDIIRSIIIKHNKYKTIVAWKNKMYKEEQGLKKMSGDNRPTKKEFDTWFNELQCPDRKIFATILEDQERLFVEDTMDLLKKEKYNITSYNYDGFQILKKDVDLDVVENIFNTEYPDKRHKYIKWLTKNWREKLDLSKLKSLDEFDASYFDSLNSYGLKRDYFNQFHFKVKDQNVLFYRESKDGKNTDYWNRSKFSDMYEDLRWFERKGDGEGEWEEEKSFILDWFKDPKKRSYTKNVFKPPPLVVREHQYNSWKGFPIELEPFEICIPLKIYKHFKEVMANGNNVIYNYLLDYFAHIIQYPGRKTGVCLVFQGEEGTGKSAFLEKLCEEIVGHDQLIIPSHSENVFGRFCNLKNKLICIYNEANGKDFMRYSDSFKNKITAKHSRLEIKGGTEEHFIDTTNFILTTNNLNSCLIQDGSRRYLAMQISNKYKKKNDYFEPLFDELDNPSMVRCFFEEMKKRPISNFHPQNDIPTKESKLHTYIIEANHDQRDKFLDWLVHYTGHDHDMHTSNHFELPFERKDDEVKSEYVPCADISVKAYRKFCFETNIPKTSQLSKASLDLFLNNVNNSHNIFDKKRVARGMVYKFKYDNLKSYCIEKFGEEESEETI